MNKNAFLKIMEGDLVVCDIVFANLIGISACFFAALIPFVNLALPILLAVYFEVGVFGFILKKEKNEACKFEDIFISIRKYTKIFCLFVLKAVIIIFWACFLIVPGVIAFLDYCFSPLILFESDKLDSKGVLLLSKELVRGHRWKIFLSMLIGLAIVLGVIMAMFGIIALYDMFFTIPKQWYVGFLSLAGLLSTILFALPYVQITITECYNEAKMQKITR